MPVAKKSPAKDEHKWVKRMGMVFCIKCLRCRNSFNVNGVCRPPKIGLRSES